MNYTDHKVSDHFPDVSKMDKHIMNHTDNQLQAALAKMLPELLYIDYFEAKFISIRWLTNKPNYGRKGESVLDTELLHLCWLVEENLTSSQIEDESEIDLYWWEIYRNCDSCEWLVCHASWQQRVIALAKIKGIEI